MPGAKEGSRYPATEVLLSNSLVKTKIVREEDQDMPAILHACRAEGMRDFTHSLYELVQQGLVSRDVALEYAPSRENLISMLKGIDTAADGLIGRMRS